MNIRRILGVGILIQLLAAGCASNQQFKRIDALRRDRAWPTIRAAAEIEIARREGNTQWSYSANYIPHQHTNGVWAVAALGAYPRDRFGDKIDLLIRDGGEVIKYSPSMSHHTK